MGGRLKLKRRKTAIAREDEKIKPKLKRAPEPKADEMPKDEDEAVELTEAEAKFLSVKNRFKRRTIEKGAPISYREQNERFNEKLKSYPLHNDLEGE